MAFVAFCLFICTILSCKISALSTTCRFFRPRRTSGADAGLDADLGVGSSAGIGADSDSMSRLAIPGFTRRIAVCVRSGKTGGVRIKASDGPRCGHTRRLPAACDSSRLRGRRQAASHRRRLHLFNQTRRYTGLHCRTAFRYIEALARPGPRQSRYRSEPSACRGGDQPALLWHGRAGGSGSQSQTRCVWRAAGRHRIPRPTVRAESACGGQLGKEGRRCRC